MSDAELPELEHEDGTPYDPDADDERTYVDLMREYECPDGCDFVDLLSEDEALALFIADQPLCPLCDEELERSEESMADLLAFVDESTTNTPASAEGLREHIDGMALHDAFEAIALAFFRSQLWFVWCGPEPLRIVDERGRDARRESAALALNTLIGLGWRPPAPPADDRTA